MSRRSISGKVPNRRGAVLLLFGLELLIIGLSMTFLPTSAESVEAYAVANDLLDFATWGMIWTLVGGIGCLTAWWPTKRDDIGFMLMSGFIFLWSGLSFFSWIMYGAERGWSVALLWLVHSALLAIVSGMDRNE